MANLSDRVLRNFVSFSCPRCTYSNEIQILDARVQAYRRCPCCHILMRLVDRDGSLFGALEDVGDQLQQITDALKGMF